MKTMRSSGSSRGDKVNTFPIKHTFIKAEPYSFTKSDKIHDLRNHPYYICDALNIPSEE